jgi:hypothetical protein
MHSPVIYNQMAFGPKALVRGRVSTSGSSPTRSHSRQRLGVYMAWAGRAQGHTASTVALSASPSICATRKRLSGGYRDTARGRSTEI